MRNHSITLLAVFASMLVLSLLFVSYRERQARVASTDEPCSADEQPLEWKILGVASRLKLAGSTIAKAFGI